MGDFIYNAGDSKQQQQLFPYGTTPPHSSSTSPPLQFMPSDDDQGDISMLTDQSCWQNPAALTNPASCDLQDILLYYRSQPELLRLILLSKVEEDKRRTEEARLRAKELDMLLLQQQQELVANGLATADPTSLLSQQQQQQQQQQLFATSDTKTVTTTAGPTSSPQTIPRRSSSALGYPDEPVPGLEDPNAFSPTTTLSSSSTPNSFLHLASNYASSMMTLPEGQAPQQSSSVETESMDNSACQQQQQQKPPRRRREMQAITKIVETRENPYVDGYFWKNNGNTVQKKTGNKSIYYKCSNSSKGCPVNKTVMWKENGEYLIKYRGEHLPECGKVQRIVDV
ncbi:hypothetical protein VTP01DRAFT_2466 [Rhizomucor pusillus]|uniref:uncharacterized protein n=1 Tax=Rhizomucor pusillus TaxID=4840 RepID=UPI0037427AFA